MPHQGGRSQRLRATLFDAQRGICHYCETLMLLVRQPHPDECTIDHLIPEADGGTLARTNVVGACFTCNNARGDMPYEQFVALVKASGRPAPSERLLRKVARREKKKRQRVAAVAEAISRPFAASHMSANRPYLAGIAKYPTLAEALAEAGAVPEELNEQLLAARERWES